MKILVYGAGVLGSYLAHVLCTAGHEVSLLARGQRQQELAENGLVIRHYLQKKTTVDHPRIVASLEGQPYDAIFAVMQYQQMPSILASLAAAQCPLVVLVGNNLSAPQMAQAIQAQSLLPKTVLFGFQATAGRREHGKVICIRKKAGGMHCGALVDRPDAATRAFLDGLFQPTRYRLSYQPGMDAWYKSHLALILPISYLCYALDCDLTRATRPQWRQALDAAREGYALLGHQGYPILPKGEEAYFQPGIKRFFLSQLFWLMAKTALGRLIASDHCKNAVLEMQALHQDFMALRGQSPAFPMPAWDALCAALPGWDTLQARYAPAAKG